MNNYLLTTRIKVFHSIVVKSFSSGSPRFKEDASMEYIYKKVQMYKTFNKRSTDVCAHTLSPDLVASATNVQAHMLLSLWLSSAAFVTMIPTGILTTKTATDRSKC